MKFNHLFDMSGLTTYGVLVLPYTFVLTYDRKLNVWSVSWSKAGSCPIFIGEKIHPESKLPFFKTRALAEEACEQKLKELNGESTNQSA